jgi:hypothetical protein
LNAIYLEEIKKEKKVKQRGGQGVPGSLDRLIDAARRWPVARTIDVPRWALVLTGTGRPAWAKWVAASGLPGWSPVRALLIDVDRSISI